MKFLISLILFSALLTGTIMGQENFKVIKVSGTITLKTKGTSLETGTVFSEKEDLLFRTEDATAAVINSQKGRLILTNKSHDLSASGSNFLPSMYNMSTRGAGSTDIIELKDLMSHFSGKYVVIDKQAVVIDPTNFPMNSDHFFYLRYRYKGEDINKKLDYSGDSLILNKKSLFTVDGNPIPSPDNTLIKLFYRTGSESHEISEFDLIFPDTKLLKKEINVILDEIRSKSSKEKIGEINSYINDVYGKIDQKSLSLWLNTTFGLKQ
jgi:hemerythrin superfamily protein